MHRPVTILVALSLSLSVLPLASHAAWLPDGTPVSVEDEDQIYPTIGPDGRGGTIVVWQDYRHGMGGWLYGQRVTPGGTALWTSNGAGIATEPLWKDSQTLVSSTSCRTIVAYSDDKDESGYHNIYVNCLDSLGARQWDYYGVPLCTAADFQLCPVSVTDGAGGAIVAWYDFRNGSSADIYARRVDANGTPQWTANGVALCKASGSQWMPRIVSDGAGGAIVAWYDGRGGSTNDIYARRISSTGTAQWTSNGVAICTATGNQDSCAMVPDGSGGAIIVWRDRRNGTDYDTYAQRINSSGTVQWTTNGVAVCTAAGDQGPPVAVSDGAGGVIVLWPDKRNGTSWKLYCQRVGSDGVAKWTANGVAVCPGAGDQMLPAVCSDGAGGVVTAWTDARGGSLDIYTQRLDVDGALRWQAGGVPLCTASRDQYGPAITADGTGGAFVAWSDERGNGVSSDVYSQHVDSNGLPGCASNSAALSGDVVATVVARPYESTPQSVGLPQASVRVLRDRALVGTGGLTSNPGGSFSFTESVGCGDQLASLLENPTLSVISLTALPSGGCTASCQSQPLVLGSAAHFVWNASDAVNAMYLAEHYQRQYWQATLDITLTRPYQIRVNDQSASTQRLGGGSTGVAAGSGNPVTGLAPGMAQYADAVYHEFVHRVIAERFDGPLSGGLDAALEARGMDEGLADYFTAAFTGNSSFGSNIPGVGIRELDQATPVRYSVCDGAYREDGYYGARIVGGALWDARKALVAAGAAASDVDRWVYDALEDMRELQPLDRSFRYLRAFLLTTPPFNAGSNGELVRDAFDRHNISDDPLAICTPRPQIRTAQHRVDAEGQHLAVTWSGTPTAVSYRLYLRAFSAGSGLATGTLVADSLTDSSYVYSQSDTSMVLTLLVAGVDAEGNESPISGEGPQVTGVGEAPGAITTAMRVWPNPGTGPTTIAFGSPLPGPVRLTVFDLLGRRVRNVELPGGSDRAVWDGTDDSGRRLGAGVYLIRVRSPRETRTIRVVIVR